MLRRFWESSPIRFIREMVHIYFRTNVLRASAELAYFLILSIFPILICVNAFVGALHVNVNYILSVLEPMLPPSLLAIVSEYLRYITVNSSAGMLAAGLIMTLFSSSAAMRALMNIMGEIYGSRTYKGFWQILASVIFSLLLLVTIYLSMVVVLTGNWFFRALDRYLPFHLGLGDGGAWQWVRFWILFGMVLLLIVLVYLMSAPREKDGPRPPVFLGSLLAAAALVASSMLFSWFIGMSSRYSLVYGSLASVVILMLWLYLCGNIIIVGNVFNCVWYRRKKERLTTGGKREKKI